MQFLFVILSCLPALIQPLRVVILFVDDLGQDFMPLFQAILRAIFGNKKCKQIST